MAELSSRSVRVAPPCPACGESAARHLDEVSKDAFVDFYECAICHHLWTIDKRDESKVRHITPFVRPKQDRHIGM